MFLRHPKPVRLHSCITNQLERTSRGGEEAFIPGFEWAKQDSRGLPVAGICRSVDVRLSCCSDTVNEILCSCAYEDHDLCSFCRADFQKVLADRCENMNYGDRFPLPCRSSLSTLLSTGCLLALVLEFHQLGFQSLPHPIKIRSALKRIVAKGWRETHHSCRRGGRSEGKGGERFSRPLYVLPSIWRSSFALHRGKSHPLGK